MTKNQLKLREIVDPRIVSAMQKVDRAKFVPDDVRDASYEDRALPIGYGQTISQPYIVALMSRLLELNGYERVLEIGTGSGYQAAVLAELVNEVYTVEIVPELASRAEQILKSLGYSRIHSRQGNGAAGWPEAAPFDAVIVTCAPEHVPVALWDQLKEGGKLVIPVGPGSREQTLVLFQKVDGAMVRHPIIPVSFVPMTGEIA